MPTVYPIAWEPIAVTGRYRNLQRRDVALWERWIVAHGEAFEAVAYDVAVGGVEPIGEDLTPQDIAGWRYSTAQKIDVCLRDEAGIWCIEVKPAGHLSSIGAAIAYPKLLERDEPDLAHLPRLSLQFNRRNLGRLREMIDQINRGCPVAP